MNLTVAFQYAFGKACRLVAGALLPLVAATPSAEADKGMSIIAAIVAAASAVVGATASVLAKSYTDQRNESHRAKVSVEAKRRERVNEKQAEAIAGIHEKLSLYADALRGLYLYEAGSLTDEHERRARAELDEAHQARRDFERCFAANELHLPEALSDDVQRVSAVLRGALLNHRQMARDADVDAIKKARKKANKLLSELKDEFRRLLLWDGARSTGAPRPTKSAGDTAERRPGIRKSRRRARRPSRGRTRATED